MTNTVLIGLIFAGVLMAQPAQKPAEGKIPFTTVNSGLSKLPAEEVSEFWRVSSEASMAQMALERTREADQMKAAMTARQGVIERLQKLCGDRTLTSATEDQASKLGVRKDTPICVQPEKPEVKK